VRVTHLNGIGVRGTIINGDGQACGSKEREEEQRFVLGFRHILMHEEQPCHKSAMVPPGTSADPSAFEVAIIADS